MRPIPLAQLDPQTRTALEGTIRECNRRLQCPARTSSRSCSCIDQHLGWPHGLPLEDCDDCFSLDPWSDQALAFREQYARSRIDHFSTPENLRRCSSVVASALLSNHMPRDRALELLKDPEIQFAVDRTHLWQSVQSSWKEADQVAHLTGADFIAALTSRGLTNHRVDGETYAQRHLSCTGRTPSGEVRAAPCPSLTTGRDSSLYCGACGCPQSPLSRISGPGYSKLHYPTLSCPRKRKGFSNHVPEQADLPPAQPDPAQPL